MTRRASPLAQAVMLWPNPAGAEAQFRSTWAGPLQLRLRDAYGRIVRTWAQTAPGEQALRLDGLAAGPYWLEVATETGRRAVLRVVKQ